MKKCEFLFQQTFPEFFLLSPPIEALFIWVLFIKLLRGFVLLWGMTLGRVGFLLLLWKQLCVCDKQKFKLNLQIFILCVSQDQADLQAVCSGRRRTCALLNSPLPCVNKAIYHIQELKMTVEDWCQQVNWCQMWGNLIKILRQIEDRSKNQLKSIFFPFCLLPVCKISATYWSGQAPIQQNFKVKSALLFSILISFFVLLSLTQVYLLFNRFQSRDSDTESVTSTELFVEGIAINAERGEQRKFHQVHKIFCLNW